MKLYWHPAMQVMYKVVLVKCRGRLCISHKVNKDIDRRNSAALPRFRQNKLSYTKNAISHENQFSI
jgi:hypothetical protein